MNRSSGVTGGAKLVRTAELALSFMGFVAQLCNSTKMRRDVYVITGPRQLSFQNACPHVTMWKPSDNLKTNNIQLTG